MRAHVLFGFWPLAWLSVWLAVAATATAARLPVRPVLRHPPRLRTPLLSLHVSALRLNPHAGQRKPYQMRALRLIPALPAAECRRMHEVCRRAKD